MGKWKAAAANMHSLWDKYSKIKVTEVRSVHKNLIFRTLPVLYRFVPEAEKLFEPQLDIIIDRACAPDRPGDYEKGMGRHYYCGSNASGHKLTPKGGYYKNGISFFSKSARTMLEEDYTMALTLWKAGFDTPAAEHLGRALHMLEDICCLPHATRMTYYSSKKMIHEVYEDLAKMMYPDNVDEQEFSEDDLHLFDDRNCFGDVLNKIVEDEASEPIQLLTDPVTCITNRIYSAEKAVIAFLFRFFEDMSKSPDEAHYITEGMKFDLFRGCPPLTARITPEGIEFLDGGQPYTCKFLFAEDASVFRAAHRKNGSFTFSPVSDQQKGRALVIKKNKLRAFNPLKDKLYTYPIK